jgi:predicted small lipoprotein YifL
MKKIIKQVMTSYEKIIALIVIFFFCGMLTNCGQSGHLYLPANDLGHTQQLDK